MIVKVEKLTETAFAKFGNVLGEPDSKKPNIVDAISNVWLGSSDLMGIGETAGKHVTYLKILRRPDRNDKIEKHETSAEAFIPMEGRSVLIVVPAEATDEFGRPDMEQCRAFYMDGSKGVLMKPGTWHAVPSPISGMATYIVLVDDAIISRNDLHVTSIEDVEFDLSHIQRFKEADMIRELLEKPR
jgi:ureidoglycolate hydrolase